MSSGGDIYEACAALYDVESQVSSLLRCISERNQELAAASSTYGAEDLAGIPSPGVLYTLMAGALVFFMQLGFAMLCAGSIRAKNVQNVILWNLLDSCGGGVAFWAVGWAFMYGGDNDSAVKTFIGNTDFFVGTYSGVPLDQFFFQWTFACALSSIVAGTIAERTQMKAYLMYSFFLVGFVYPVAGHALWSTNGFLSVGAAEPLFGSGAIDLAGSGGVHMTGGVAALVGAIILGPRLGRFYDEEGVPLEEPRDIPPHSVSLQFLGTFALWFGWYGFNSGSVFATPTEDPANVAALVIVNTTLAACAGALSAMFTSSFFDYRATGIVTYDTAYTMNGCLTGLVAVTAGCGTVETWAAVVIGIVAGWLYLASSALLVRCRIDDAVDAVPVHMVGGAWGMISTGLFSTPALMELTYGTSENVGWFYEWGRGSGNFRLLGAQLVAILFLTGWSFTLMGGWFYMMHCFRWLRLDPLEEEVGMDQSRHKGSAYDVSAPSQAMVHKLESDRLQAIEKEDPSLMKRLVRGNSVRSSRSANSTTVPDDQLADVEDSVDA